MMFSMKIKFAVGALAVGGLLLATPFVDRGSRVLNVEGHCLAVVKPQRGDSEKIYSRGTIISFEFDVDDGVNKFRTDFGYPKFRGADNNQVSRLKTDKMYCPNFINKNGLVEFIYAEEEKLDKKCSSSYFSNDTHIDYASPDEHAPDMEISCNTDERTPACTMYLLSEHNWQFDVHIQKTQLSSWRAVYDAGQVAIKERLEPLSFCPIQVPFL